MISTSDAIVNKDCSRHRICFYSPITWVMTILMLCIPMLGSTQEIDYIKYKFYKEEYVDTQFLFKEDTIATPTISRNIFTINDFNIHNSLYNSGFRERGGLSNEEVYTIGGITLHRSTAQRLLALGVTRETFEGLYGALHGGTTLSATRLMVGRERGAHSDKHTLRTEISGKGYIAGISHDASWLISPTAVKIKGDWEINHNIRFRTGRDLYVDGVFSNSVDCAIEASRYTHRHSLSLAATLSFSNRGLRASSSEEAFSLRNNPLYNPTWGIEGGEVRNSRVRNILRPDIIALWEYRLTASTTLHIATNIGFESIGTTSLEWFDAITPMPDNYRYMPSYYSNDIQQLEVTKAWVENDLRYTQIDWAGMRHTNMLQQDGHARYAVAKRKERNSNTALSAYLKNSIAGVDFQVGMLLNYDASRNYKVMHDLLGATHIIDRDYYLINDATYSNHLQNNLLTPNCTIHEGDRYGFDYRLNRLRATLFGTASWNYNSGIIATRISFSSEATHRRGFFEKELFPDKGSYGRSASVRLTPYHISAHWQHYIQNHRIGASLMLRGASPEAENMFLQQDYNNRIVRDLTLATTFAIEANYGFALSNRLTLIASLFYTGIFNDTNVVHYYDDLAGEYVDGVVNNIATSVGGIEAKANVEWSQHLNSSFMLSALLSRYTSIANIRLYSDSDNHLIANTSSDMRGYRTGAPEVAAYGDIELSLMGWRTCAALHYCGLRHVAPSFTRRSTRVLNQAFATECRTILESQQRLKDVVSLDITLSKIFHFETTSLGIQLSVRNIIGNSNIISGYEQNRVRRVTTINGAELEPFASRMMYNYPRLFHLNITLRF